MRSINVVVLIVASTAALAAAETCSPQWAQADSGECVTEAVCKTRYGAKWQTFEADGSVGCMASSKRQAGGAAIGCCTKLADSPVWEPGSTNTMGTRSAVCDEPFIKMGEKVADGIRDFACGQGLYGALGQLVAGLVPKIKLGPCSDVCKILGCSMRGLGCKEEYEHIGDIVKGGRVPECAGAPLDCVKTLGMPDELCRTLASPFYWGFNAVQTYVDTIGWGDFVPSAKVNCSTNPPTSGAGCLNTTELPKYVGTAPEPKIVLGSSTTDCSGSDLVAGFRGRNCRSLISMCVDSTHALGDLGVLATFLASSGIGIGDPINVALNKMRNNSVVGPCTDTCRDGVCLSSLLACPQSYAMIATNKQKTCGGKLACDEFNYEPSLYCETRLPEKCPESPSDLAACREGFFAGRYKGTDGNITKECCNLCVPVTCKADCPANMPRYASDCKAGESLLTDPDHPCCNVCGVPPSVVDQVSSPASGFKLPFWVWIIVGVVGCLLILLVVLFLVVLVNRNSKQAAANSRRNAQASEMNNRSRSGSAAARQNRSRAGTGSVRHDTLNTMM